MSTAFGPQGPNYASSRPAPDADVSGGVDTWFKDCSAQGATDGTYVTSDFLNVIVDQLRTLVRTAGVTLNKANSSMVYQAVQNIVQSFYPGGTNWQSLPGGYMLQWGHTDLSGFNSIGQALPHAWNTGFQVGVVGDTGGAAYAYGIQADPATPLTWIKIFAPAYWCYNAVAPVTRTGSTTCWWIVLGK